MTLHHTLFMQALYHDISPEIFAVLLQAEICLLADENFLTLHDLTALQKADQKREDVGVELYGYQQQLAKLQLGFEKAQDQCLVISRVRRTLEEQLDQLKKSATSESSTAQKERQKARWSPYPIPLLQTLHALQFLSIFVVQNLVTPIHK